MTKYTSSISNKKSQVAQKKARDKNGHFIKADSPEAIIPTSFLEKTQTDADLNKIGYEPKRGRGRPPKAEPDIDPNALPEDFHEKVGTDAKKAFESLLSTCQTRYEAAKIAKELLPYQSPKLSNVESYSTEVKTIEIKWLTDGPQQGTIIDGTIVKELTDESSNGL